MVRPKLLLMEVLFEQDVGVYAVYDIYAVYGIYAIYGIQSVFGVLLLECPFYDTLFGLFMSYFAMSNFHDFLIKTDT